MDGSCSPAPSRLPIPVSSSSNGQHSWPPPSGAPTLPPIAAASWARSRRLRTAIPWLPDGPDCTLVGCQLSVLLLSAGGSRVGEPHPAVVEARTSGFHSMCPYDGTRSRPRSIVVGSPLSRRTDVPCLPRHREPEQTRILPVELSGWSES